MKRICLWLLALTVTGQLFAESLEKVMRAEVFTKPAIGSLPYRLYVPAALAPGAKVPLVLFLHGADERGTNNVSQLRWGVSNLVAFAESHGGAVILAPQCPVGAQWVEIKWSSLSHTMPQEPSRPMKLVLALVQQTIREQPVDPARVYVTGMSMGGYGTWDIAQRCPRLFAAAMPLCGGGDTALAPILKRMPIWMFHGEADTVVPPSRSRDMYAALQKAGNPHVQYREYPQVGHNCWVRTYADSETLSWLFSQKRQ